MPSKHSGIYTARRQQCKSHTASRVLKNLLFLQLCQGACLPFGEPAWLPIGQADRLPIGHTAWLPIGQAQGGNRTRVGSDLVSYGVLCCLPVVSVVGQSDQEERSPGQEDGCGDVENNDEHDDSGSDDDDSGSDDNDRVKIF